MICPEISKLSQIFDLTTVSSNPGLQINDVQKKEMEREAAKHGLGVITAAIFLAGEMAGSGVLALPFAMTGTGKNALKF